MIAHTVVLVILVGVVVALITLLVIVFEIKMFIAVLQNPQLSESEKLLWCSGMLLIHPFVALAYYFLAHGRRLPTRV